MADRPIDFCWEPAQASTEHEIYDRLIVGSVQTFTDASSVAYGWVMGRRLGAFRSATGARERVIQEVTRSLIETVPPDPNLVGTHPLVLYFGSEQDRDEFAALMKEAKPGLVTKNVGGRDAD